MNKLKIQNPQYIDKGITEVFHFLELKAFHHAWLIGSSKIRDFKYSNDFDLNQELKLKDSRDVLEGVRKEFLHIFQTAYSNPAYYITDFKCGYVRDEPIRWSWDDIKRGWVEVRGIKYSFAQCLIMPDNVIKLDLCYLLNNLFTDINILYLVHLVGDKKHLEQEKEFNNKLMIGSVKKDIEDLIEESNYFKAIKRYFSLQLMEKKVNDKVMNIINSDYGMFYKFISLLDLVLVMLVQTFKPIDMRIIRANLENIKMFGSKITAFDVDGYLDKVNKIVVVDKDRMVGYLSKLITECKAYLNKLARPFFHNLYKLKGGGMGEKPKPDINSVSNYRVAQANTNAYFGKPTKLYLSDKPASKYYVIDDEGKKVYFGSSAHEDYTKHNDEDRRIRFKNRNRKWANNPKYSASSMAYHILW